MNRVISWLQNFLLHQVLVICLIGATFFVAESFIYSSTMIAHADVQTPEGIYYKGTPDNEGISNDNRFNNVPEKLKSTAENVREKLNLDEETPRATKEFQDTVTRKARETVEPITGSEHGYYQEPQTKREIRK